MNPNDLRSQSALDLPQEQLDEIALQLTHLVSDYFRGIRDRSVRPENHAGKTLKAIDNKLNRQAVPLETLMNECRSMFDLSRHNGHPRFFGYVASPSTPIGAYADLVASALNANITCWRSA